MCPYLTEAYCSRGHCLGGGKTEKERETTQSYWYTAQIGLAGGFTRVPSYDPWHLAVSAGGLAGVSGVLAVNYNEASSTSSSEEAPV